jgi:phosphatidylserine decarboxylase
MTIHKEGRSLLFYLLIIFVAINLAITYFLPEKELVQNIAILASIILYLLVLQFFRIPTIKIPINSKQILAPADGTVVVIEKTTEQEYFNEERIQISIFMSPLNVHINRSPVAGIIKFFKYHPGKYLMAWNPKASEDNERTTMVIQLENGVEVLVRQIAGFLARRIKWYVKEQNQLGQGQEFGFIKFGSRVDVFLPLDAKILIENGAKTKGGRTPLAELA